MNIAETILAGGDSGAPAILQGDACMTYGELRARVDALARALVANGRQPGDRVGIWSENTPLFVTVYLGAIRAGLVVVPLQTDLSPKALAAIVRDAGLRELFVSKRALRRFKPLAKELGLRLLLAADVESLIEAADSTTPLPGRDERRDVAALMFTSGSTGAPKGVMVSHRNIECNTRDIISYMGLTPRDRVMVVLPFHYCFGMSLLHTHLMAGGSLVLNNLFMYPEKVLEDLRDKACTGIAGVPSTYQILLRKSRFRQMELPALRWFQQAGGKLPNPFIAEILESFPHVRFFLMYGQTEATARLSYLPPERLTDKLGSIGKGLPSVHLEVLKQDGSPVVPGSGETGEIVASGDNITLGYWHDPDETAKFFRDGKLHTGDVASVDADGFIFVVEREREFIKSGGNRVSAKEVEDVLAELPEIVEVAVLGMPHELLGEAIQAYVVLTRDATITPDDVLTHCRKRLPTFKAPESIEFIRTMPKTSAGKVSKPKLKQWLATREGDAA